MRVPPDRERYILVGGGGRRRAGTRGCAAARGARAGLAAGRPRCMLRRAVRRHAPIAACPAPRPAPMPPHPSASPPHKQEIAADVLKEQSPKALLGARGKLYELLVNCIPPEVGALGRALFKPRRVVAASIAALIAPKPRLRKHPPPPCPHHPAPRAPRSCCAAWPAYLSPSPRSPPRTPRSCCAAWPWSSCGAWTTRCGTPPPKTPRCTSTACRRVGDGNGWAGAADGWPVAVGARPGTVRLWLRPRAALPARPLEHEAPCTRAPACRLFPLTIMAGGLQGHLPPGGLPGPLHVQLQAGACHPCAAAAAAAAAACCLLLMLMLQPLQPCLAVPRQWRARRRPCIAPQLAAWLPSHRLGTKQRSWVARAAGRSFGRIDGAPAGDRGPPSPAGAGPGLRWWRSGPCLPHPCRPLCSTSSHWASERGVPCGRSGPARALDSRRRCRHAGTPAL